LNQERLLYFNTKEDLIRSNKPVFNLDLSDIVEINRLSNEFVNDELVQIKPFRVENLCYFYIKIEKVFEEETDSGSIMSTKVRYSSVNSFDMKSRRSTLLDSKDLVYI
jgi:hypothetical protein